MGFLLQTNRPLGVVWIRNLNYWVLEQAASIMQQRGERMPNDSQDKSLLTGGRYTSQALA